MVIYIAEQVMTFGDKKSLYDNNILSYYHQHLEENKKENEECIYFII